MKVTPEVEKAIDEIRTSFPDSTVKIVPDENGGAFITVEMIELGSQYNQPDTWIGFQITFQYPHSDVYPHFVRPDLSFKDKRTLTEGQPLGEATSTGKFQQNIEAIQISRRSNKRNSEFESATLKLHKVIKWLNTR